MTPADIETLVALVERWQQATNDVGDGAPMEVLRGPSIALLAWKRPAALKGEVPSSSTWGDIGRSAPPKEPTR